MTAIKEDRDRVCRKTPSKKRRIERRNKEEDVVLGGVLDYPGPTGVVP